MVLSDGQGLTTQLGCGPGPGPAPGGSLACLQCSLGQVGEVGGPGNELGPVTAQSLWEASSQKGYTAVRVGVQGTCPDLALEPFPWTSQPPSHTGCCVQWAPTRALKQEAAQRFQLERRLEREGAVALTMGARTGERGWVGPFVVASELRLARLGVTG